MTEILSTEKLTDERWLNLFARTLRRDGKTFRWVFASRKPDPTASRKADAVLVVPILIDGVEAGAEPKLIATREWRAAIGGYEWGIPAGLVDGDESLVETARRELLEETGYVLVDVLKVSPPSYSSTGMTDESAALVFCTCRTPADHRPRPEETELIEVHPLSIRDIDRLIDTSEPINARTWGTFYLYHRLGRLL